MLNFGKSPLKYVSDVSRDKIINIKIIHHNQYVAADCHGCVLASIGSRILENMYSLWLTATDTPYLNM